MNIIRQIKNLWAVLLRGFTILRSTPQVVVPYLYLVLFHGILLAVLFLIPRPPLSSVLGPIIRAFWGEQSLHYPYNLTALPQIYSMAKNLVDMTAGVLCAGIMISMISQSYQAIKPDWLLGLKRSLRRYFRLAAIWALTVILVLGAGKLLAHFVFPRMTHYMLYMFIEFVTTVLIQAGLIFVIPAIVIENRKIVVALQRSLALLKHHFIETMFVVAIPCAFFIPLAFINTSYLMNRYFPEVTLWIMSFRIVMYVCIDLAVTLGATIIFMRHKEIEENSLS